MRISKIKPFDKQLHDKYDIPARQKIKSILHDYIDNNKDIYGADMIINSNGLSKYKYLELQVCSCWKTEKFPYDNVFIWERKGRYDNDTLFLTLNCDLTMGYLFDISKIDKNKPRRLKKYSREFVYDIPRNQALLIYLEYLTPDIINEF
jgi:hypothetical protein